jgi:molybdate transport system ATP-binding protein
MLSAHLGCRRGAFALDAPLEISAGEVVAVLGPNGAGKSTALNLLAGLEALDHGSITLEGNVFDDPSVGVFVPPEKRPIGVVFQDYVLFTHLNAVDNVAFGLQAKGAKRRDARKAANEWLDRIGLEGRSGDRVTHLSGGQQQRVALARALAVEPRMLLLDEPLAALDAGTRSAVRRDLRRHLNDFGGVTVLVTHDPVDAFALADRVVILEEGRIVQQGSLHDVAARPKSNYVADLIDINLVRGTLHNDTLVLASGVELSVATAGSGEHCAAIATHGLTLHRERPEGSARNVWQSTVGELDERASRVRVRLDDPIALVAEITLASCRALDIHPGGTVWVSVKATEIAVYPA